MNGLRRLGYLTGLLVLGCGSGTEDSEERVGEARAELSTPLTTPVPCCRAAGCSELTYGAPTASDAVSIWPGTNIQLLFADALVTCAKLPQSSPEQVAWSEPAGHDRYLDAVLQLLRSMPKHDGALLNFDDPKPLQDNWTAFRNDPAYNCDPVTLTPGRDATLPSEVAVKELIPGTGVDLNEHEYRLRSSSALRDAGINACIARTLRGMFPGSSASEALLMPAADQRALLELIRERAQIAMLNYALLAVAFIGERTWSGEIDGWPAVLQSDVISHIQAWADKCVVDPNLEGCGGSGHLAAMGRDFLSTVDLHVQVTKELVELARRSRSSKVL